MLYQIPSSKSIQIEYVSFITIVMVLYIHSSLASSIHLSKNLLFLDALIGDGICRIAVPFFFLRSGFFFFLNVNKFETILIRLKKRFKTLLFPYLLWAFVGLLFLWIISQMSILSSFIVRQYPWYSVKQLLQYLLFNPINYQLWFLRDLFLLCLLSPLLYFFIRYCSWIGVFCLLVVYVLFPSNYCIFYSAISLFFFVLGGQLSIHRPNILEYNFGKNQWLLLALFVSLTVFNAFAKVFNMAYSNQLNMVLPIFGIICLWNIVGLLLNNENKLLNRLAKYSFFIYLAHEPFLTFIKKVILTIIPQTEGLLIALYLFLPLLVLGILFLIAQVLQKRYVRFYSFIVGGR